MARIATKTADGTVKILDTSTGVESYIGKGDRWSITEGTDYSTLYWLDDPQVVIYEDTLLNSGNLIFGAATPSALSSGIISGSIDASNGGSSGGAVSVNSVDITVGIQNTTIEQRLLDIKNELIASKSIADLIIQDSAANPNFYVRQEIYNDTTGVSNIVIRNLDGSPASPAPTLPLVPAKGSGNQLESKRFEIVTAGGYGSIGNQLTLTRILNAETGAEISRVWFNDATLLVASPSPAAAAVKPVEDAIEDKLSDFKTTFDNFLPQQVTSTFRCVNNTSGLNYAVGDTIFLAASLRGSGSQQTLFWTDGGSSDPNFQLVNGSIPAADIVQINKDTSQLAQLLISLNEKSVIADSTYLVTANDSSTGAVPGDLLHHYFVVGSGGDPIDRWVLEHAAFFTPVNNPDPLNVRLNAEYGDTILAGQSPSAFGNNAQVVTIDVNSSPIRLEGIEKNAGLATSDTTRTVTASDSPEIPLLTDISQAIVNGAQRSQNVRPEGIYDLIDVAIPVNGVYLSPWVSQNNGQSAVCSFSMLAQTGTFTGTCKFEIYANNDAGGLGVPGNLIYQETKTVAALSSVKFISPLLGVSAQGLIRYRVVTTGTVGNTAPSSGKVTFTRNVYNDTANNEQVRLAGELATPTDNALVVTLREPITVGGGQTVTVNTGVTDANTTRTVAATDSPEVVKLTDRTQKSQITNGTIEAGVKTSNALAGDAGLIVRQVPDAAGNTQVVASTVATSLFGKVTDGTNTAVVKGGNQTPIATDSALTVTLSPGSATTQTNQTLATSGFTKLTDGVDQLDFVNAAPGVTAFGLPVRLPPDSIGNTVTTSITVATALFAKLTDGVNNAKILPGGVSVVGSAETSLVVSLSPNSAATNTNQTLATSGFTKLTDGTDLLDFVNTAPATNAIGLPVRLPPDASGNTVSVGATISTSVFTRITDGTNSAAVNPASTTPAGTAPALVTVTSPNSPEFTSLVPSVVGSRAVVQAARYTLTVPTLTDLQQNSLRLDNRGSLVVTQDKQTTQVGQINPAADTALTAGKKVYRVAITNTSATVIFLQFHNTALAIATGAVPNLGMIIRVPAGSTLVLDETTFGDSGELISNNTRIGLSSTFGTYTALIAGTLASLSLNVKLEA